MFGTIARVVIPVLTTQMVSILGGRTWGVAFCVIALAVVTNAIFINAYIAAGSNPKKVQEGQKKGAEVDDDRVQTQTPEPWYTAITDTFAQQFLLLQQPPVAHAIGTQMLHGMHFEIVKQYQVGGHSDKK